MGYAPPPPNLSVMPENYPSDGLFKRVIIGASFILFTLLILAVAGFGMLMFMIGLYKWGPF